MATEEREEARASKTRVPKLELEEPAFAKAMADRPAVFYGVEAEPRGQCVPSRSLGTRERVIDERDAPYRVVAWEWWSEWWRQREREEARDSRTWVPKLELEEPAEKNYPPHPSPPPSAFACRLRSIGWGQDGIRFGAIVASLHSGLGVVVGVVATEEREEDRASRTWVPKLELEEPAEKNYPPHPSPPPSAFACRLCRIA